MGHYDHSLIKVSPHPYIYLQFLSFFLLTLRIIQKSITGTTYFGSWACCVITGEIYVVDPAAQLKQLPSAHIGYSSLPHCHLFLSFISAFFRVWLSPRGNRSKLLDIHPDLLRCLFLCELPVLTPHHLPILGQAGTPGHSSASLSPPCRYSSWLDRRLQSSFVLEKPEEQPWWWRHSNCSTSAGSQCGCCRQQKNKARLLVWCEFDTICT